MLEQFPPADVLDALRAAKFTVIAHFTATDEDAVTHLLAAIHKSILMLSSSQLSHAPSALRLMRQAGYVWINDAESPADLARL